MYLGVGGRDRHECATRAFLAEYLRPILKNCNEREKQGALREINMDSELQPEFFKTVFNVAPYTLDIPLRLDSIGDRAVTRHETSSGIR